MVSIAFIYAIMLALIQGPVYAYFSVEKHGNMIG